MASAKATAEALRGQGEGHRPWTRPGSTMTNATVETAVTQVNGQEPMNLQDTYDEWRRSGFAEQGIQCQHCHMAADPPAVVAARPAGHCAPHRSPSTCAP